MIINNTPSPSASASELGPTDYGWPMKVETNDPRPAYVQIADDLRKAVESGDLAPGARLPSGRDLAARYGVAVMTVQRALGELRAEGLVTGGDRRGVFVRRPEEEPGSPKDELTALREMVVDLAERVSALESRLSADSSSPRSRRAAGETS